MSDPITFTSASPRFGLPFLFPAQAQKEFFVNEAHALLDMLLHPAIEGQAATPPANVQDGDCWLVGPAPGGAWAGHAGKLACLQAGSWTFATPRDGMRVLDRATGQELRFHDGWHRASAPHPPSGGLFIDNQARGAITALIAALVTAGVFPES